MYVGKLFQHGLKDATPRRMSTFINMRIINPKHHPTLNLCNALREEEQAKVTDAPLPTYSLPQQEHVQGEGKGGGKHPHVRGRNPQNTILPKTPRLTTTGGANAITLPMEVAISTQGHGELPNGLPPHTQTPRMARAREEDARALPHILTTKIGRST